MERIGTFTRVGVLGLCGAAVQDARCRTPVRRGSRLVGREGTFWRPVKRKDARRIVLAAKVYERAGRGRGQRSGPLGPIAVEVIELLANIVSARTGQLDPSIETMKRKLNRSRDAIVRALAALRRHGFIDWLRRYVPTGNETGPQVRQASNAYRLALPERALRLLGGYGEPAPIPDDFAQLLNERDAERERMVAQLSFADRVRHKVEDGPLADALARLGRAVQQRESAERGELESPSISYGAGSTNGTN